MSRIFWTVILVVPVVLLLVVLGVLVYSVLDYLRATGDFLTVLAVLALVSALMGTRLWWSSRIRDKQ